MNLQRDPSDSFDGLGSDAADNLPLLCNRAKRGDFDFIAVGAAR